MKKLLIAVLLVAFSPGDTFGAQKIAFTRYPGLKLGFTTVVFTKCQMGPSVKNIKALIDYANEEGYAWIELRDPNGDLTLEQAKEIATYAKPKKIEIGYATARGPLDPDFAAVLAKAVQNGAIFRGATRTVRTVDANAEFVSDKSKNSWTESEFQRALRAQNSAAKAARAAGLQLVVENANLPLFGKFSLDEFLSAADPEVGYQLDTANMFVLARSKSDAKGAEAFLRKHILRLQYTHLKSSVSNEQSPVLSDNPLPFETVFRILGENKRPYIAIELGQVESCDDQKSNLKKSLDYLQRRGFISRSR